MKEKLSKSNSRLPIVATGEKERRNPAYSKMNKNNSDQKRIENHWMRKISTRNSSKNKNVS